MAKQKALLGGVVGLLLTASASGADPARLTACGHHDYAPWSWKSGNKIVGACADLTKTLFERAGVRVDLSYIGPWKRCQRNIEDGIIDINICGFSNRKRAEYATFVQAPIGFSQNFVFVKKGREFPFKKWEDLSGKTAGMVIGVSTGDKFDAFLTKYTKVEWVKTHRQNFKKLVHDRIEFLPAGRLLGLAMMEKYGLTADVSVLPNPIFSGKHYISMSKKSRHLHLIPKIDKLIRRADHHDWVNALLKKHSRIYLRDQHQ